MFWLVAIAAAGTARDAWGRKPVMDVTLAGRWDRLAACGLDDTQIAALRELAAEVSGEADAWRRAGDDAVRAGETPRAALQRAAMAELSAREATEAERLADVAAPCLLDVLDEAWEEDRHRSAPVYTTVSVTYEVYATQYAANTDDEVAVPDYCVKFANLGWETCSAGYGSPPYDVLLDHDGDTYTAWVGDVGPWNIDDNYWNTASDPSRPRRLYTDLAQGYNEARAAYYDDYNGGEDQYGRTVGNPAGIDLAPDTAAQIGLSYLQNAWIDVTWLWEGTTVWPSLSMAIAQDPRADQPADSRGDDGITDVYPGQTWTVRVDVANGGTEKANGVRVDLWVEEPWIGTSGWVTSDGASGTGTSVDFGGIDPGETETVTVTLVAVSDSAGSDHPDLRAWVGHVDDYYEKAGFFDAPSANVDQAWNGGELRVYTEHDVWPQSDAWDFEDGTAQGWWAGDAVSLAVDAGALAFTPTGDDPWAVSPPFTSDAPGLHVTMGGEGARLYWATADAPGFDETRAVDLAGDYVAPGWTAPTRLRVDPAGALVLDELWLGAADDESPGDSAEEPGARIVPGRLVLMGERGCGGRWMGVLALPLLLRRRERGPRTGL